MQLYDIQNMINENIRVLTCSNKIQNNIENEYSLSENIRRRQLKHNTVNSTWY